ncbi:hypothetical protein K1719_016040 [Acacia pycnantha]|nr:hypothetical protein K1719_016040 [Acacia pycnantha]
MYSSRGGSGYGQSYAGQSAYGQNLGSGYSGGTVGGPDVGRHSVASWHSAILGTSQEVYVSGYQAHSSTAAQYGGQYSSVYGSAALSSAQQVPSLSAKGAGPSALKGRGGYAVNVSDSPKFASGDYLSSSSHGYGHKSDQLYGDKVLDYSGIDRRQYGERQSAYMSRGLQNDPASRYAADPVGFSHQHQQPEIYDRIDQTSLLRQEQLLKAQSLQFASLDGSSRQTDYLAVRAAASRHPTQYILPYGGRIDADPCGSSMLSAARVALCYVFPVYCISSWPLCGWRLENSKKIPESKSKWLQTRFTKLKELDVEALQKDHAPPYIEEPLAMELEPLPTKICQGERSMLKRFMILICVEIFCLKSLRRFRQHGRTRLPLNHSKMITSRTLVCCQIEK